MAKFAQGVFTNNPDYQLRHLTPPARTESGPFSYPSAAFQAGGMSFGAGTWVAGNFLVFVSWDICEADGPCGFRMKETTQLQRDGGQLQIKNVPMKTPSIGNSWTKDPLKQPVGGCNKSLIYVDAPGGFAQTVPVQGTPAAGFTLRVDETLEVFDVPTGKTVGAEPLHLEIGIDKTGTLSASP
jgi:hypothetical protein